MGVFVIAEAGSSHDNDLQKAYRLIEAAKECGADAVKFQWTSDARAMARNRWRMKPDLIDSAELAIDEMRQNYEKYLQKPVSWLESLKVHADKVGIEFMCTVYLIEDIATIAPLVKRFKVSAYESGWTEFMRHHYPYGRQVIASVKADSYLTDFEHPDVSTLYCVSKYPTSLEDLKLRSMWDSNIRGGFFVRHSGLSDHTANVLTGAASVAAGASIVEAHIRLDTTPEDNPDYAHSLMCNMPGDSGCGECCDSQPSPFDVYVSNIRTVESML